MENIGETNCRSAKLEPHATVQTTHLTLQPHHPEHLLELAVSPERYERASGLRAANGLRDFLLAASPAYFDALRKASAPDPWKFGYAIIETGTGLVVGMCGFVAPPGADGTVEIAYGIAPAYQGKGYATEAAHALVEIARANPAVRVIRAHTLAERNASTRVLEKCGFKKVRELFEEKLRIWRWEK